MTKAKRFQCILLAAIMSLTVLSACFFTACGKSEIITPKMSFDNVTDFIKAVGDELRTDYGDGDVITLRGVNAGGLFVTENWMNAFDGAEYTRYANDVPVLSIKTRDNKSINEVFIDRFGAEKTVELWQEYRANYWSDIDFANCAAMGINVIRLPFTYMSIDTAYHQVPAKNGKKYNFDALDAFVDKAEEYGLYTILDMHGAYGSQNGQDHSGQRLDTRAEINFYDESGAENRRKTVELWSAIAEHFVGRAAVAGYDILNEPAERESNGSQTTVKKHWDFFDEVYNAIRKKDEDHVVIIESCWTGKNIPQPGQYGWKNVMYSFHQYTGESNYDKHIKSFRNFMSEVESNKFGVPIYMGEFTCYTNEQSWVDTLKELDDRGWSWTVWAYKITPKGITYGAWGVYCKIKEGDARISPASDSFETLMAKFKSLHTEWTGYEGTPTDFSDANEYRKAALNSSYTRDGWEKTTAQIIYESGAED